MIKNDKNYTIQQLKDLTEQMVKERDWQQFHSPKNASMGLMSEAGELMDHFLWCTTEESYQRLEENRDLVEQELADVMTWVLLFSWENNIDLAQAVINKLEITKKKYPVEKCKGSPKKYTEY